MNGDRWRGQVDPLAETNKTVIRRFVARGLNGDDRAVFDELLAADVVVHRAPAGFLPGREGWKQNVATFRAAFPDGRWCIEHLVAEGDTVVARIRVRGTHLGTFLGVPPSGRSVTWTATDIVRIVDGKMVEYESEHDELGLLEQIGARPGRWVRVGANGGRGRRGSGGSG